MKLKTEIEVIDTDQTGRISQFRAFGGLYKLVKQQSKTKEKENKRRNKK